MISCFKSMVRGPWGGQKCVDPTHTDTGGARHYAALLLGQGAWCVPCTDGDCLQVPVMGLADQIEQRGPGLRGSCV